MISGDLFDGARLAHLSSGDLLRDSVAADASPSGAGIGDAMSSGQLVPDRFIAEAVRDALEREVSEQQRAGRRGGFLLDGFPRTVPQARAATGAGDGTWPRHLRVSRAIHVDVPDRICARKIAGRRHCPRCGTWFNVADASGGRWVLPPVLPAASHPCACAGSVPGAESPLWTRRDDDVDSDVVRRRLADYHAETEPVLDIFREKGLLLHFRPYRGMDDVGKLRKMVGDSICA